MGDFEIKYDRDGMPIKDKAFEEKMNQPQEEQEDASTTNHELQEAKEEVEQEIEEERKEEKESLSDISASPSNKDNIRHLREKASQADYYQKERDDLARKYYELEQRISKAETSQEAPKDDFDINEDDLVDGKTLKKYYSELKQLKEQNQKYQQQVAQDLTETRIKTNFPDFEQVANESNLRKLRAEDPDLADYILSQQDPYKQAALAYKMVKRLGIHQDPQQLQDKHRAVQNSAKPTSPNAIGRGAKANPLSQVHQFENRFDDNDRQELWKQMQEAINSQS